MPARRMAVSYNRFSDPKQAAGDSEARQEREYKSFCERHDLTPGKEVFADRGRSGYHGAHRTHGRLGQLIEAAKDGRFEPGTVVVIEAWDRLGRLRPDRQTELVAELLRTGVHIGVCRLNEIFTEDDFGTHKWTTLAVFVQLAHQESRQKADRVAESWERRRQSARENGTMLRGRVPAWVEVCDGGFRLIPERAAVIRRIFAMAKDGMGHTRIVRALQEERVPAFGECIVRDDRKRSQFAGKWTCRYVGLLLTDRRVIGELQPTKNGKPCGAVLTNYYPAAVSEEDFALARAGQDQRLPRDRKGRQSKHVNVFKGMLTHARDGDGFLLHNIGKGDKPNLRLLNATSRGKENCYTFPYAAFEEGVLGLLREIDPATVLPTSAVPSSAESLRAKLANIRADIAGLKDELRAGFSKSLVQLLREAEATEVTLANELQDELARTTKPLARAWDELPTLIDVIRSAPDPDSARLRVRAVLRGLVESAHVLIVRKGIWGFAAVQFAFVGGASRHYIIAHKHAGNGRVSESWARSFAAAGLPPIDLRKPADVAKVEKLLTRLKLDNPTDAAPSGRVE